MTNSYCPQKELEQFTQTLSVNDQVTLVGISDFGYAYTTPITVKEVTACSYAQYDHAVKVTFREKRKRTDSEAYFYASHTFSKIPAVVSGHPKLRTGMQFNAPSQTTSEGTTISQAKYSSFDTRNVTDILDDVPAQVIFRPSKF